MNKNPDKFQTWLKNLRKSGKTDEEIGKLLAQVAKYSSLEIYEAIMTTLTKEDMQEVEKIKNDKKAKEKIEELFKKRAGMTINELVANTQLALIEESRLATLLKKT